MAYLKWKDLKKKLEKFSEEQLNEDVAFYDTEYEQEFAINKIVLKCKDENLICPHLHGDYIPE